MDIKRLPWITGVMVDLGLTDKGDGFWEAEDGRAIYIGRGSVVIMSQIEGEDRDFETQHRYPTFPDVNWLLSAVQEHQEAIMWRARGLDLRFN